MKRVWHDLWGAITFDWHFFHRYSWLLRILVYVAGILSLIELVTIPWSQPTSVIELYWVLAVGLLVVDFIVESIVIGLRWLIKKNN
ncbi:hypothetical protein [Lactiplantibacillus fabifermentans]|uniref:Uncharacterized protein n=2 Tax=Lactiplantibacillus fabifermentans TaxID=483011 RepID=A0A0R2NYA9_9LACO|nr:hypothetical protein [Lactiplantibacillus fabifermentans]ETY73387.1 hypothetical protein LFAB_12630 [Lactiplantibacillus fabifermentans T30PCM01]KRO28637.1 hypothetical protein DY78_GL002227 [Lactiplantibacillus fabifermentans DSM 21115]